MVGVPPVVVPPMLVPAPLVTLAQPGRPVLLELLLALFVVEEFSPEDEPCGWVCGGNGEGEPGVGAAGLPVICGFELEADPLVPLVGPVVEPGAPVDVLAPALPPAPPPLPCANETAVVAASAAAISGSVRLLTFMETAP